jgi:hypothetical protein
MATASIDEHRQRRRYVRLLHTGMELAPENLVNVFEKAAFVSLPYSWFSL